MHTTGTAAYHPCKIRPSIYYNYKWVLVLCCMLFVSDLNPEVMADSLTAHLSRPNMETGFERLLGLGMTFPHPYFQKPKYRYPVYDREGRGYLRYGYGGPETYEYKEFNTVDGLH